MVYIACSFTTVWMIYSKFKATYDGNHDTFRVEFLVIPTAILAFLVNHDFTPLEVGHLQGPGSGVVGWGGLRENGCGQWAQSEASFCRVCSDFLLLGNNVQDRGPGVE